MQLVRLQSEQVARQLAQRCGGEYVGASANLGVWFSVRLPEKVAAKVDDYFERHGRDERGLLDHLVSCGG
jgi:hypothetical protein